MVPLNLATYGSRSIDSATLPFILPSVAAAGYARSYQLMATPITQVQMALGATILRELVDRKRSGEKAFGAFSNRLWALSQAGGAVAAVGLALASGVIEDVLFGPKWPQVHVLIAATASLLPALTTAMFFTWLMQLDPKTGRSAGHLAVALLSPAIIIGGAVVGQTQGAVIGALVAALVVPLGLCLLHRHLVPGSIKRFIATSLATWLIVCATVVAYASLSGFWEFSY